MKLYNLIKRHYAKTPGFDINKYIEGEEIILIKGSRGIHLEKVAEALGVTNAL